MKRTAIFSDDHKHRYLLTRIWDESKPICCFVMFNPSFADDKKDDPTIKRCIGFAVNWGYGGIYVVNIHSYITSKPKEIKKDEYNRIENRNMIIKTIGYMLRYNYDMNLINRTIICAWGNFKVDKMVIDDFLYDMKIKDVILKCIKQNKNGSPAHPLYLKSDLKPIIFDMEKFKI